MSRYTIKIEKTRDECKNGTCGHPHEIPVSFKQKQIVCHELSCNEVDGTLIRHIFVPYDGSQFSNHAFEFALDVASKYGSHVTVVTVIHDEFSDNSFLDMQESGKKIFNKEKIVMIEKAFEKIHQTANRFGITVRTEVLTSSSIADTLVSYASSNKVDLIVMSTRGRGDTRLMLGSVSIGVSQKASCAVMLIK